MVRPARLVLVLGLVGALGPTSAVSLDRDARRSDRSAETWAGTVVSRISQADMIYAADGRRSRTVTIRVRIAADGALEGAAIEEGSGATDLDERALRAVRAAAPFPPPPRNIVTLEGFTEISFPLQLATATRPSP